MIIIHDNNVQSEAAIEREIKFVMFGRSESSWGDGRQNQSWWKQGSRGWQKTNSPAFIMPILTAKAEKFSANF